VLQCVAVHIPDLRHDRVLDIQHYSVLQCVAVYGSVLQRVAVHIPHLRHDRVLDIQHCVHPIAYGVSFTLNPQSQSP